MNNKVYTPDLFSDAELDPLKPVESGPVQCLGMEFDNEEARREYFRDELRRKLPELRQIEGFPIGEDEDIIRLSDPPYYTACPNPWLNDFIQQWEEEKKDLTLEGKRSDSFKVSTPYASDVSEGKNNPVYMAHAYHTKVPHPAIMRYIMHYTQPGDIVFDGFSGTGMTGVAAGKCCDKDEIKSYKINGEVGLRHCILGDLSPIASFITYNFNNPIDKSNIVDIANNIISNVKAEYGYLYKTKHIDGNYGEISYVIWSDILECPNCSCELSYWKESVDEDFNIKQITCPKCGNVIQKSKDIQCKETSFSASGDVVTIVKKEPVYIRYSYNGKKYSKIPDSEDLNLIKESNNLIPKVFFPKNKIIRGVKTDELIRSGYSDISMLYTRRNLILFSSLWDKMKDMPILRFALTAVLVKTGSLLHNIGLKGGKINLAGALPNALFVPSALAERNVFELLEGKIKDLIKMNTSSLHRCVNQIQSATDLANIKNESVDYIFTDPPFGHNLMYSELNFIHEGWLNIFTNNKEEAIENSSQNKNITSYSNLMTASFSEYFRILKPGKWMTVEFSNTSASIWNAIQRAISKSGFVISVVRGLDKQQGSYNAQTSTTAVKQDLVISCYKPTSNLVNKMDNSNDKRVHAADFIEELLQHLPVHTIKNHSTTAVVERSPKILYDRLISYYVQRGWPIPMDAGEFQDMLRNTFIERDGMFFTASQALEYEEKRKETKGVIQMSFLISNEEEGIMWLKDKLKDAPKTYQEIQPDWMTSMTAPKKGDRLPELLDILEENFIKDEDGYWRKPDAEKAADLEALRLKRMAKEFALYLEQARKPKAKRMKDCRLEVLRYGFKDCYKRKDYEAIIAVGDHIQESLLLEDEILLQYYDSAAERV